MAGTAMFLSSVTLVAAGQNTATASTKTVPTPKATELLMQSYQYLGSLDKYSFEARIVNTDIDQNNTAKKLTHYLNIKVDRPGNLRVDIEGDVKNKTFYLSNGAFTMMDHTTNYYGQLATPKTIDQSLDYLFDKFGIKMPIATLVYSDMDKRLKPKKDGYYFGAATVCGVACHYVAFADKQKDVHVWIENSKTPLIRKYIIIDKLSKGTPRNETIINSWNTNPSLTQSDFAFKAPKDAYKITVKSGK